MCSTQDFARGTTTHGKYPGGRRQANVPITVGVSSVICIAFVVLAGDFSKNATCFESSAVEAALKSVRSHQVCASVFLQMSLVLSSLISTAFFNSKEAHWVRQDKRQLYSCTLFQVSLSSGMSVTALVSAKTCCGLEIKCQRPSWWLIAVVLVR